MPLVRIDLWKGVTTVEQKRKLVKGITDTVSDTIDCPKEAVHIIISEQPKENWGVGGVLSSDKFPER